MSDNNLKTNYILLVQNFIKKNLFFLSIFIILLILLFSGFQLYKYYTNKQILKSSIIFNELKNSKSDFNKMSKLSNEKNFYGLLASFELINNQSILEVPKNTERHIDKTSFDVLLPKEDSLAPTKAPILGHSFRNPEKILELTTAIDVVFYRGGDAEISGFELGKDLLWFFLSSEELLTAKSEINHKGDLVLDFADTGTLTFLGVVESMPMETAV